MLSQKNIISNIVQMRQLHYIDDKDTFLSFLPLHHSYECTCGFLCQVHAGSTIAYAQSLKKLIPYTKPYKKTIFIALSLILMITAFDLSIPYLPKIAIDRYILSFFCPVNYSEVSGNMGDDFNKKYRRLVETEKGFSFISNSNLKKMSYNPKAMNR